MSMAEGSGARGAIDALSRDEIRRRQLEQLQVMLNRAYFHVDFYRRRMDEAGILPEALRSIEDLRRFPFTTSGDLAQRYPYGLFAEPLRSIVRLKITSDSEGNPIVVGFTRRDVAMWQSLMVRLYERVGVTDRDIVQVAFNFSQFPGAFTFSQAAEMLGATMAPSATASATLQLKIMRDFRSTVLATTPAFALHIADVLECGRTGMDRSELNLRVVLLGPDPVADAARERIEAVLRTPVYGLYGVTEMVEPGLAGECPGKDGLHAAEDHFLLEIVHPVTGEPVPEGSEGELVVTTLTTEAYPLIRYRTGDVTTLRTTACACGRTSARIAPVLRRTDSRTSVRGNPVYPEHVGAILRKLDPGILDYRLIVHTRYGMGEQLDVLVVRPVGEGFPGGGRSQYLEMLRSHVRRGVGVGARVQLVDPERLPREGLGDKVVFRSEPLSCEAD
jgi:phenylacetate-CoA ligase